jgi:7-keto-8-aminopelargonate synthetase-like enzyme
MGERNKMASKTVVTLLDDIDGKEIGDDGGTVTFSFEGVNYQIDLAEKNLSKFRKTMTPYVAAATKVSGQTTSSRRPRRIAASSNPKTIREWARSQGYEVSDRGRVPASVVTAYEAAN